MNHEVPGGEPVTRAATAGSSWEIVEADKGSGRQHRGTASREKEIPVRYPPDQVALQEHRTRRVCPDCVLQDRIEQWDQRPAYLRAETPDWATPQGVRRDLKMQNKGRLWNQAGQLINAAKKELRDGSSMESSLKRYRQPSFWREESWTPMSSRTSYQSVSL